MIFRKTLEHAALRRRVLLLSGDVLTNLGHVAVKVVVGVVQLLKVLAGLVGAAVGDEPVGRLDEEGQKNNGGGNKAPLRREQGLVLAGIIVEGGLARDAVADELAEDNGKVHAGGDGTADGEGGHFGGIRRGSSRVNTHGLRC